MKNLNFESYELIMKIYGLKAEDYELWSELLGDYDDELLDKAIRRYIKTQTKAPRIADIAKIVEEMIDNNEQRMDEVKKPQEEKLEALSRLYNEVQEAEKKGYKILFEKIPNGHWKYSWMHKDQIRYSDVTPNTRYYLGLAFEVYILNE